MWVSPGSAYVPWLVHLPEGIEGRTQAPGQCSAIALTFALPGHQANSLLFLGQRFLSQQNATCRAWTVAPLPPGWLEGGPGLHF